MWLVSPGPLKQPSKFDTRKAGTYRAAGKNSSISLRSKGQFCLFHFCQELWFSFSAKTVCIVWPHKNIIASLNNSVFKFKFKGSVNVLLSPSLQTQIQLCSWKWREQALILGKTTIIPLSIAFTLVYLALLVCFCTATWQYDTFTFWLETYLPKHLVGKQKTMTALQQRKNNLYCRNQRRRWKVKPKERKTRKKAMIGRGKKTWHEKMAEQEKIWPRRSVNRNFGVKFWRRGAKSKWLKRSVKILCD